MLRAESETTASRSVIEAVAATTDTSPIDLPPLYDAIDPDSLDAITESATPGTTIDFEYCGVTITVTTADDGDVTVRLG